MSIRSVLKQNSIARFLYYRLAYIKNAAVSAWVKAGLSESDKRMLHGLQSDVNRLFPNEPRFSNEIQYSAGRNIIGQPALGFIKSENVLMGWGLGQLTRNNLSIPFLQVAPDLEHNLPLVFETYRPEYVVDFGTASGGSAVFFYELMARYTEPHVLSVDISDHDFRAHQAFHNAYRSESLMKFIFGKSSIDCGAEVKSFLATAGNRRILLSFDDLHTYEHTYQELLTFTPMLKSGDVVLMQDTWDQGLYGHETSPMLAVYRFLREHPEFYLDEEFHKRLKLPCNFIYGVLVRK